MSTSPFYLHFVTDLRRVVFCIQNKNSDGARTFLAHAHSIYEQYLKHDGIRNTVAENFDDVWMKIFQRTMPQAPEDCQKYAEEILTLSSIIFIRSQQSNPLFTQNVVQSRDDIS